jgi:hypothetical protein
VGSFLVAGRFRSTEQLLSPGFSFYRDGDGSSRRKSEARVKEWNKPAGNQTGREGGGVEKTGCGLHLPSAGEEALTLSMCSSVESTRRDESGCAPEDPK